MQEDQEGPAAGRNQGESSDFKKHNIEYAPTTTASKQSVALKELQDEISYLEIVRYTDNALRSMLLAEGVLRSKKERPVIMCWSCGSRMEAADSGSTSLRCSGGRACPTRARLSNVDDAFTPFAPTAASGCGKDLATFVRTAWCYGMKAHIYVHMYTCIHMYMHTCMHVNANGAPRSRRIQGMR